MAGYGYGSVFSVEMRKNGWIFVIFYLLKKVG